MSVWIQYGDVEAVQIETGAVVNVYGLKRAVKAEMPNLLGAFDPAQTTLSLRHVPLDPRMAMEDLANQYDESKDMLSMTIKEYARTTVPFTLENLREVSSASYSAIYQNIPFNNVEGINLSLGNFLSRDSLVDGVLRKLTSEQNVLFWRAPPFTGKTSMSQLLFRRLWADSNCIPILLTCLDWPDKMSFDEAFKLKTGMPLTLREIWISFPSARIVLIMDEVHLLYKDSTLWEKIKLGFPPHVFLILFAGFGETASIKTIATPFNFLETQRLGLNDLMYSREEFDYLFANKGEMSHYKDVSDMIWNATRGHCGLTAVIGRTFHELVVRQGLPHSPHVHAAVLISPTLTDKVRESRAFLAIKSCDDSAISRLHTIALADGDVEFNESLDAYIVKVGLACICEVRSASRINRFVDIPCPLLWRAFMRYYRERHVVRSSVEGYDITKKSIDQFMVDCLANFKREALVESFSIGIRGNIREAKFQDEFYFVSKSLLLSKAIVDPEVGPVFGLNKFGGMDIYIDGDLQLGFEFLINGAKLKQHVLRFYDTLKCGSYPLKSKLVVDFRLVDSLSATVHPPVGIHTDNLMFVLFTVAFDQDGSSIQRSCANTSFLICLNLSWRL